MTATFPQTGTGSGGPETDPVAQPALAAHIAAQPAHGGDLAGTARPPTAHGHPQSDITGLAAALTAKADAATAVLTSDTRLSNARTPTAHAASHAAAGADSVTPAAIGAIPAALVDLKGDLIVATANDTPARLAVGGEGTVPVSRAAAATGIAWEAPAGGGGGILATIVDVKGDLIVATAADTVARLPVGADGKFLAADATQTTGLKWDSVVQEAKARRLRPTGAITETFSRQNGLVNASGQANGTLRLSALMYFPAGVPVTNLVFYTGTTPAAALTNAWACIVGFTDLTVKAVTGDNLTAAMPATTRFSWPLSAVWTPTQDEWCYFGLSESASTPASTLGGTLTNIVADEAPLIVGNSTTGLTTPLAVGTVVAAPAVGGVGYTYAFAT